MAPHLESSGSAGEDEIAERFLQHLAEAVRFPTVSDTEPSHRAAFGAFRRWVAATYPQVWATGRAEVVGDDSLVFDLPGRDRTLAPVLLIGHIDVVPIEGGTERAWSRPPFGGERDDTHLYGRGAIDDKGSVVAILEAVEERLCGGEPLERGLVLAFGHDEEASGRQGAATIARMFRDRDMRFSLVLDEGGFVTEGVVPMTRRPVALVGVAEKGYLDVELVATSTPGHSATPASESAIAKLAAAIDAVGRHPMPLRPSVQRHFFRAAARAAHRPLRPVLARLPRLGRYALRRVTSQPAGNALLRTTITPTVVEGGSRGNMLPARARALLNARILPGDTTSTVLEHIKAVVGNLVTVRPVDGFEPSPVSSHTGAGFAAIADVIRRVHPDAVVAPWVVIGATDSRYYARLADEVFRFTPFRVDTAEVAGFHGVDERIRIADASPAVDFYRLLVRRVCGP